MFAVSLNLLPIANSIIFVGFYQLNFFSESSKRIIASFKHKASIQLKGQIMFLLDESIDSLPKYFMGSRLGNTY